MDDTETSGLVRVGTVSAVNKAKRQARVMFKDAGITSDWLPCLQHFGATVSVASDGSHDHKGDGEITNKRKTPVTYVDSEGVTHTSYETVHTHKSSVTYWVPKVNDTVLVLYLPAFNADGVVLGGI